MIRRLAPLCAAALLAACAPDTRVSGSVAVTGSALGEWTLAPTSCVAGSDAEFYGVDLSDARRNLRVDDDPLKGYVVTVSPDGDPGDPRAWLSPTSGCKQFAASVQGESDGWGALSGSLILDCTLDTGAQVAGRIDWSD